MRLRQRAPSPDRRRQPRAQAERAAPAKQPDVAEVLGNQAFANAVSTAVAPVPMTPRVKLAESAGSTGWLTEESKPAFLSQLSRDVHATAEDVLAGTGFTPANCPWISYWFAYYAGRSAQQIEQAAARYAPETRGATSAEEMI